MSISTFPGSCRHQRLDVGPYEADLCPNDRTITWFDGSEQIDSYAAFARLFGSAQLLAAVPGVRTPGPAVLAYRPAGQLSRSWMRALPAHEWFQAVPDMFVGHDGENLLLCPLDPLVVRNLSSGLQPVPFREPS